jgi:hypothetical protein
MSAAEGAFRLTAIEDELVEAERRSRLLEVLEERMLADPGHWQRYYRGGARAPGGPTLQLQRPPALPLARLAGPGRRGASAVQSRAVDDPAPPAHPADEAAPIRVS